MTRLQLSAAQDALVRRGFVVAAAVFLGVGGLGLANGGYFPVSWGWSALGLLALLLVGLATNAVRRPGLPGAILLASLVLLTVWTAASVIWTVDVTHSVDEVERAIVYVAAAAALLAFVRAGGENAILLGVWAAASTLCTYGLAIWLFPHYLGYEDASSRERLSAPLGYWNAFGVTAAIGILLALGLSARARSSLVRALAAASLVVMVLTLYFTFSRGGWIALGAGLAFTVAIDRRRLQLVTTGLVVAPWAVVGVWLASRSSALTHTGSAISAIERDGHGVAAIAVLLAGGAAFATFVLDAVESRVVVRRPLHVAYGAVLVLVVAAGLSATFVRYGSPVTLAQRAYRSINSSPPGTNGALNSRLFSLSSNGRSQQFHTAWQEVEAYPWLGSGAGTFDVYWFQHRRVGFTVHDVHNLYLETLAELGPLGLVLLVGALAVPLAAVFRARARPLAAAAFGAYAAFLLHAAVDWDWEMPAVTLAGLFCGLALLAGAASGRHAARLSRTARAAGLAATVALGAFVVVTLLGNRALSASSSATDAGSYSSAEQSARRAMSFLPWSAEPWRRLGEAQAGAGNPAAARASFRKAIAKEPRDWTLWFDLAQVSSGRTEAAAFAQALRLNPLSPELAAWRSSRRAAARHS